MIYDRATTIIIRIIRITRIITITTLTTKEQHKHSIFLPRKYPSHYNHKTDLEKFMMDFKSYSKGV